VSVSLAPFSVSRSQKSGTRTLPRTSHSADSATDHPWTLAPNLPSRPPPPMERGDCKPGPPADLKPRAMTIRAKQTPPNPGFDRAGHQKPS